MKKIILTILLAVTFCATSANAGVDKILVPADKCDQIISTTFSTGGGDNTIQYATITCKKGDQYFMHLPSKVSGAGFIGKITGFRTIGRLASDNLYEIVITNAVKEAEFD